MSYLEERLTHVSLDISNLSKNELESLRVEVDRALKGYEEIRKAQAIMAAEETLQKYGFSLQDLTQTKSRGRKKAPVVPKYSKPGDPQTTWSGRGRRPFWVVDHLDSGGKIEDLKIKP